MLRTHLTVSQEVMELESRPTNWPLPGAEEEEAVVQRERGAGSQERCMVGTRFQRGKTKMFWRRVVVTLTNGLNVFNTT